MKILDFYSQEMFSRQVINFILSILFYFSNFTLQFYQFYFHCISYYIKLFLFFLLYFVVFVCVLWVIPLALLCQHNAKEGWGHSHKIKITFPFSDAMRRLCVDNDNLCRITIFFWCTA